MKPFVEWHSEQDSQAPPELLYPLYTQSGTKLVRGLLPALCMLASRPQSHALTLWALKTDLGNGAFSGCSHERTLGATSSCCDDGLMKLPPITIKSHALFCRMPAVLATWGDLRAKPAQQSRQGGHAATPTQSCKLEGPHQTAQVLCALPCQQTCAPGPMCWTCWQPWTARAGEQCQKTKP